MRWEGDAVEIPPTIVRGPGRSKLVRTGRRGRPRKLFHDIPEVAQHIEEATPLELTLLSEVPLRQAGPDSEWRDAMA